jgi:hypothetical protein
MNLSTVLTKTTKAIAAYSSTPAMDALRSNKAQLAAFQAKHAATMARLEPLHCAAADAQPALELVAVIRARRVTMLGEVALGEATEADLDALDQSLVAAEAQARVASRALEVTEAGIQRLEAEITALNAAAQPIAARSAALIYEAGKELVEARLDKYKEAMEALGRAHAEVAGACMATDALASITSDPRRLPITGELHKLAWEAPVPNMALLDPAEWVFDFHKEAEAAKAAVLAELGG